MIITKMPIQSAKFNFQLLLFVIVWLTACSTSVDKTQKPAAHDEKVLSSAMSMLADPEVSDKSEALSEFERACELGNNYGCHKMGIAYNNGIHGKPKDFEQAKKWYEKAATRGYVPSQLNIANMYAHRLLPLDDETGYLWLARANKGLRECRSGAIETETVVSDAERQRMCQLAINFYRKVLNIFRKRMEGDDMSRIDKLVSKSSQE